MNDTLFPEATSQPKSKAPSLMEQIEGVFTAPKALFDKLHAAPSWVPALILAVVLGLVVAISWGLKVDVDAMLRPMMEANPKLSPDQVDQIIQMQSKFILPFGILGVLFGVPIISVLAGLINWGLGRAFTEEGAPVPTFLQGLSSAIVPSLVRIPDTLIIIAMCVLKSVGGHKPEQVTPLSLGYYLHSASPKLQALFYQLNPFIIANFVLAYLAMRHIVKAKPLGAAISVAIWIAFVLLGVAFAK